MNEGMRLNVRGRLAVACLDRLWFRAGGSLKAKLVDGGDCQEEVTRLPFLDPGQLWEEEASLSMVARGRYSSVFRRLFVGSRNTYFQ